MDRAIGSFSYPCTLFKMKILLVLNQNQNYSITKTMLYSPLEGYLKKLSNYYKTILVGLELNIYHFARKEYLGIYEHDQFTTR